jgi:hypothetical protein
MWARKNKNQPVSVVYGLYPLGTPRQKKNAPYCSTSVVVWKKIKSTKIKEILDFYTL